MCFAENILFLFISLYSTSLVMKCGFLCCETKCCVFTNMHNDLERKDLVVRLCPS